MTSAKSIKKSVLSSRRERRAQWNTHVSKKKKTTCQPASKKLNRPKPGGSGRGRKKKDPLEDEEFQEAYRYGLQMAKEEEAREAAAAEVSPKRMAQTQAEAWAEGKRGADMPFGNLTETQRQARGRKSI